MTGFFPLARANKQTRINMGDCESQDNEWTNSLQRFHPENPIGEPWDGETIRCQASNL